MATNKLLPFANGVGANVTDYDTWSALATLLSQGFTTGVARSDYANRVFAQGALASYVLGQFVVDQTAQDADLNESVFYTNFKNALVSYIKANAVSLDTAQTVGGVKTFTSIPIAPTADAADNSQNVATTAFVQGEIASKANASEVVKLTGAQTVAGVKTFSDSPEVPTATAGDNSQKTASTGFVQNAVSSQAVRFDSAQTLTDAQKQQARENIAPSRETLTIEYVNNVYVTQTQLERGGARRLGNLISVQINATPEAGQTTSDTVVIGKIKNCSIYTANASSTDTITAQDGHRWLINFRNSGDGDVNIGLYSVGASTSSRFAINKLFMTYSNI